jgi:hypothetical protein
MARPTGMMTRMPTSEAERQAALLRLLWSPASDDAASTDLTQAGLQAATVSGLAAHRRHARAVAARALIATYPTVTAMLGEDAMAILAARLWQLSPPTRGDLGEWGEDLAHLLSTSDELAAWPWLPDAARLDWARHRCARSPACPLDLASLRQLSEANPEHVQLVLQPHVSVLQSPWPVHGLWLAHQLPADQQAAAASLALQRDEGQAGTGGGVQDVVLWWADDGEPGGKPGVQQALLRPADASWMLRLMVPGTSLGLALSQAPAGLRFSDWFTLALQRQWLQGARPLHLDQPSDQ